MQRLSESHNLCPVPAIETMLAKTGASGTDALFSYKIGTNIFHLSLGRFHAVLQSAFWYAGLSTTNISVHSFWRGPATYAAALGIPVAQLKSQGT